VNILGVEDMENYCEEIWFLNDKDLAKAALKNKTPDMTKYEQNLLNHVILNDYLFDYEESEVPILEKLQIALDKVFSLFPFLR